MKIFKNNIILILGLLFLSCTEDKAILPKDNYINIKVPVNTDYTVGAIYKRSLRKANLIETPSYPYNGNIGDANAYEDHVKQAKTAGVDFFIFPFTASLALNTPSADKSYIDNLQTASNAGDMKFAFSYNFANMSLSINRKIDAVNGKAYKDIFLSDFKSLMVPYFKMDNYMKIGGKPVVYLSASFNLFANDNPAFYKDLRDAIRAELGGVELYLIGVQPEWTPPLRYDFRFVDCVDALTITNYALINVSFYDRLFFFHKYIDLAWSYHKETLAKYNIEFVPTISPSFNPKFNTPASPNYVIAKNEDWFKANCNIARRTSGANKLVIIDSFNDWNLDTQIESATSYGDKYLKIVKSEFKVN
jgi:hypothetical protein